VVASLWKWWKQRLAKKAIDDWLADQIVEQARRRAGHELLSGQQCDQIIEEVCRDLRLDEMVPVATVTGNWRRAVVTDVVWKPRSADMKKEQ
jgi:hypothetical protein